MTWRDDWPSIGRDDDGDGVGEPVREFRKPAIKDRTRTEVPAASDEFEAPTLGLQWQWQANPSSEWSSLVTLVQFGYSLDGRAFSTLGDAFTARPGRWVGAKIGLFAVGSAESGSAGAATFDWFRIARND